MPGGRRRRDTRLAPDKAELHRNLGMLLAELGRIAEARAAYEKAVALQPRCGAAYLNLVYCDKVVSIRRRPPAFAIG